MTVPTMAGPISCVTTPDGTTVLSGLGRFNLEYTLECGQAFRWSWTGEWYEAVVRGAVLRLSQEGPDLIVQGSAPHAVALATEYLNLRQDSTAIETILQEHDPHLSAAVARHPGLKLAQQEPWECVISYIISARNNIPSIKRTVAALCSRFGARVDGPSGRPHYAFPTPEALALAPIEELAQCRAAFRTRYIREAARLVYDGVVDLTHIAALDLPEAKQELMRLPGVGPKVADCVMLFSMGQYRSFPIDVWIARAMQHWYFGGAERPLRESQAYAAQEFGELAGYANQHLFFHARNIKLGRQASTLPDSDSSAATPA